VLRSYERNVAEKENRVSASRADEYVRNFLQNEPLPSADDEYALHKRFLPEITLAEINKLATEWFPERNRAVVVTAPEKSNLVVPDEAKLAAVIKAARTKELKPYVDAVSTAALLDAIPAPGKIAKTTTKDTAGITEWELSNGVKVILKPTTFKEDEILFRATSPGGTSLASDKDYIPASTATQVITAGGLGKFNAIDMRKFMDGSPRVCVCRGAHHSPIPKSSQKTFGDGGDSRRMESRQVTGVLQRSLRRCQRLHLRLRRKL
jgi:zinc protease